MLQTTDKLNVILIGNNIETRIVFKNALSKLNGFCSIGDYYCLDKAFANDSHLQLVKPDIIFLDTNNGAQDCSDEVRKIKTNEKYKDCSLVVYDSNSHLRDTTAIFSEGADGFINKPYDFPRLKKIMQNLANTSLGMNQLGGNQVPYFL